MEVSIFVFSSFVYTILFLILLTKYPDLFLLNENDVGDMKAKKKCFFSFFLAGFLAIVTYHVIFFLC
jgi:hypothetical protein